MKERGMNKTLKILIISLLIIAVISIGIYIFLKYTQKEIFFSPPYDIHNVTRYINKKTILINEEINVSLKVDTQNGVDTVYTIEESLPHEAIFINSEDGSYKGNKIKWVVYNADKSPVVDKTHNYIIKISKTGNYTIDGKYAFNKEKTVQIIGDNNIEVVSCISTPEICDNKDNDCDGKIDNGLDPNTCQSTCTQQGYNWTNNSGTLACCGNDINEASPYSLSETISTALCSDNKDNDCDGKIDSEDSDCWVCNPGENKDCPKQQGVCSGSKDTCNSQGQWTNCSDSVYISHNSSYEINETRCDSIDNDCDSQIDENPNLLCSYLGKYTCSFGNCICNSSYEEDTAVFTGNCDGCVSTQELSNYIYEWKINDNPEITQEELTSSVYNYLKGGSAC